MVVNAIFDCSSDELRSMTEPLAAPKPAANAESPFSKTEKPMPVPMPLETDAPSPLASVSTCLMPASKPRVSALDYDVKVRDVRHGASSRLAPSCHALALLLLAPCGVFRLGLGRHHNTNPTAPDQAPTGAREAGEIGRVEPRPFRAEDDIGPLGAGSELAGLKPGGESVDDANMEAVDRGDFGSWKSSMIAAPIALLRPCRAIPRPQG
jgi:hypothetical protein